MLFKVYKGTEFKGMIYEEIDHKGFRSTKKSGEEKTFETREDAGNWVAECLVYLTVRASNLEILSIIED